MRILSPAATQRCVREIELFGAATIPNYLKTGVRTDLLRELTRYTLTPEEEEKGPHRVQQHFSSITEFPEGSLFLRVRDELQHWLNRTFFDRMPSCLPEEIDLSMLVIQQYEPGPMGISPHRDGKSYVNLVAVLVLEGEGRFCICDDRSGANPRPIRNEPGDLFLMRAPGFLDSDLQPFHFVDRIVSRRTTFSLRQRKRT